MPDALEVEIIDQNSERETREVSAFMASFGLEYEGGLDYGIVLRRGGKIVATGSFKGEVLRNIAVEESLQGQGLAATLLSALILICALTIYGFGLLARPEDVLSLSPEYQRQQELERQREAEREKREQFQRELNDLNNFLKLFE